MTSSMESAPAMAATVPEQNNFYQRLLDAAVGYSVDYIPDPTVKDPYEDLRAMGVTTAYELYTNPRPPMR